MPESPAFFRFMLEHFWLAAILLSFVNAALMWKRSAAHRQKDSSTADGYRVLVRGFLFWGNLPWIVMGVGILFGDVPSVFHYLHLDTSNPYILAFYASIVILLIAGSYWLFVGDGAEHLCNHPHFFQIGATNPKSLKMLWLLCVAGGVVALILSYEMDFPVPDF